MSKAPAGARIFRAPEILVLERLLKIGLILSVCIMNTQYTYPRKVLSCWIEFSFLASIIIGMVGEVWLALKLRMHRIKDDPVSSLWYLGNVASCIV